MRTSVAIAIAAAQLVAGHTTFQSFVGEEHHFAVQTPSNGNNPIKDVTDTAMICNGGKPTADFLAVTAGSKLDMQWHHNDPATVSGDSDEPIAASHKGPVMVYIAKAEGNGVGAVWTKIFEDGLVDGKWGVDRFIDAKGVVSVTVPDLEDGEYLIRPEMIGLHEGGNAGGAQFYNGCGQIKISGGSKALPATGTDMTKAYKATDPGVLFNMYGGATEYTIPGPAVWDGASSGSAPSPTEPSTPAPAESSAAPTPSTKPVEEAPAEEEPVEEEPVEQPTTPAPSTGNGSAPAPETGAGSGSALPETFTITQFISWLKAQTGSSSKARRHARAFGF